MQTIVIPLGPTSSWGDNELRYHLRSLQENLKTDFKVVVLSESIPWWLTGVTHINIERFYPEGLADRSYGGNLIYENFFDVANKLYTYCTLPECPEEFVWAYDDQLLIRPTESFNAFDGLAVSKETARRFDNKRRSRHGKTIVEAVSIVRRRMKRNGVYNCETHAYKPFKRDKLLNIFKFDNPRNLDIPYAVNTVYRNMFCEIKTVLKETDERIIAYLHWADGTPHHFVATDKQELDYIFSVYTMISYNDTALNALDGMLKRYVMDKFPAKSIFEI